MVIKNYILILLFFCTEQSFAQSDILNSKVARQQIDSIFAMSSQKLPVREIAIYDRIDSAGNLFNGVDTLYWNNCQMALFFELETDSPCISTYCYVNGDVNGVSITYLNGDTLIDYYRLDQNGNAIDTIYGYYADGKKMLEVYINPLLLYPMGKWYYQNGRVKKLNFFNEKEGVIMSKIWYPNGQLNNVFRKDTARETFNYLTGKQEYYYKNGQLLTIEELEQGPMSVTAYYENGNLMAEGTFVDFTFFWIGEKREYHKNGRIAYISNFKDGKTRAEANIAHGWWQYFNEDGELIKAEFYQNDSLIEKITNESELKTTKFNH